MFGWILNLFTRNTSEQERLRGYEWAKEQYAKCPTDQTLANLANNVDTADCFGDRTEFDDGIQEFLDDQYHQQ